MATSVSNQNFAPLPIFTGENYDYWSTKMKTFFTFQGLWNRVSGGTDIPQDRSTLSEAQQKKLQEDEQKDAQALFYIQQAVADTIFPRIKKASSAKNAWDILQKEFEGSAKAMGGAERRDSSEEIKFKRWMKSLEALLSTVDIPFFSISVVPDELRKWNENAYMPKVVSIGPRYKGATRDLLQMEEIKWHCARTFLHQIVGDDNAQVILNQCMQAILYMDGAVRASYGDEIKLDRYELATIMFYDGCFLLALLISASKDDNVSQACRSKSYDDAWNAIKEKGDAVLTDLTLSENQIPLFIVMLLATILFPDVFATRKALDKIEEMSLSLLGFRPDSNFPALKAGHFLDLTYSFVFREVEVLPATQHSLTDAELASIISELYGSKVNRCATRLQAAGVKIKAADISKTDSNIPPTSFNFDIKFSDNGVLEIPPLRITQTSEANWRNLIAWEHRKMKGKCFKFTRDDEGRIFRSGCKGRCTWSALLFNSLICCARDVKLLKDKGIIVDYSEKSNQDPVEKGIIVDYSKKSNQDLMEKGILLNSFKKSNQHLVEKSNQDLVEFFHSITMGVDPHIVDPNLMNMFRKLNTRSKTNYATKIPMLLKHSLVRTPAKAKMIYIVNKKFFWRGYNFVAALISLLAIVQTVFTVLSYYQK